MRVQRCSGVTQTEVAKVLLDSDPQRASGLADVSGAASFAFDHVNHVRRRAGNSRHDGKTEVFCWKREGITGVHERANRTTGEPTLEHARRPQGKLRSTVQNTLFG